MIDTTSSPHENPFRAENLAENAQDQARIVLLDAELRKTTARLRQRQDGTTPDMRWRIGDCPLDVFEGSRSVCQCHNETDAARIVEAMNAQQGAKSSGGASMIAEQVEAQMEEIVWLWDRVRELEAGRSEVTHELRMIGDELLRNVRSSATLYPEHWNLPAVKQLCERWRVACEKETH